jgi:hypothetical protein
MSFVGSLVIWVDLSYLLGWVDNLLVLWFLIEIKKLKIEIKITIWSGLDNQTFSIEVYMFFSL